jgi:predicted enzyme related to lactoylglutathione lyase
MKTFVIVGVSLAAGLAHAQPASAPPIRPAPTNVLVGANTVFGPIVANLEEAVAFYDDGVGFEVDGAPINADAEPQLRQLFGLPDAGLRWQIGRGPRDQSGGVGLIEISLAGAEPRRRQILDPGAFLLMVLVRDIDGTFTRLQQLGAPIVTRGGKPLDTGGWRVVAVQDPAGHFVQLMQLPRLPATSDNVLHVSFRHTVANLERSLAFYRDALGLQVRISAPDYGNVPSDLIEVLGLPEYTQWRYALLGTPTSGIQFELVEFKGARSFEPADIADPGATWMQLRVADVDAAIAEVTKAGGTVMTTGGRALDLRTDSVRLKLGAVRDPDGLFLVLIETPSAP